MVLNFQHFLLYNLPLAMIFCFSYFINNSGDLILKYIICKFNRYVMAFLNEFATLGTWFSFKFFFFPHLVVDVRFVYLNKYLQHKNNLIHRFIPSSSLKLSTLTHFMKLVSSFYTPWKHKKTSAFLFSGGIEEDQWDEMVNNLLRLIFWEG